MKDFASQYGITRTGAGWTSRPDRGRLRFDGRDRVSFLQALVTNDVTPVEQGRGGVYAAYLTPQGRMLADLRLYDRGDFLIADVPATEAAPLTARFDGLIFTEDVRVTDVSSTLKQIAVVGAEAESAIARAFSFDLDVVRALPVLSHLRASNAFVVRTDDAELPGFDVFVDGTNDNGLDQQVISELERAGAQPIAHDVLDALRIEAGRPAFGRDMTSETIPLEAGLLERAISTSKGCYVGQEVIVRVLHRGGGRVVKRLVTLDLTPRTSAAPEPGALLMDDGRQVGALTSVAFSPSRNRFVALGYVHRDAAEPGRSLKIGDAGGVAEITAFAG